MAYFLEGLASLATGAAAITAVFTAFGLFIAGITYLLKLPDRFRAYFFYRPRHIVIPTPEEMAKYCIKEFDTYRPNENDLREVISAFSERFAFLAASSTRFFKSGCNRKPNGEMLAILASGSSDFLMAS